MSRRKDNKGRVLRTGESQRKDLIYQYRYTDALGNRKCIYASDLKTLREKEDELQKSLEDGLDYLRNTKESPGHSPVICRKMAGIFLLFIEDSSMPPARPPSAAVVPRRR